MMDTAYTMDFFDELITETFFVSPEYKLFTENLDILEEWCDPEFFLEKEVGRRGVGHTISRSWDNTKDLTRGTLRAYDDVTDGGGTLLKGIADMVVSAAGLISRIISFIMRIIANIPNMIAATLRWITKIPATTMALIRGDLRIYITMGDLRAFNERIFPKLETIILSGTTLSQGDNWGTYLAPDRGAPGAPTTDTGQLTGGRNDVGWKGLADRMEEAYKSIASIQFEKSIVKMTKANVNIYFGPKSDYYKEMARMVDLLNKRRNEMINVQEWIEQKLDRTTLSQTLSQLNTKQQMKAKRTIQTLSKTMTVIGNFLKYLSTDMNTITTQSKRILEKQGLMPITNQPDKPQSRRQHAKDQKVQQEE